MTMTCKLSTKKFSAEYKKSPFFNDTYKYITEGHVTSQIKGML